MAISKEQMQKLTELYERVQGLVVTVTLGDIQPLELRTNLQDLATYLEIAVLHLKSLQLEVHQLGQELRDLRDR
jgi:hypothetical protein